jgi:hypothetical protein
MSDNPPVTDELLLDAVKTERMIESGPAYFLQGRVCKYGAAPLPCSAIA